MNKKIMKFLCALLSGATLVGASACDATIGAMSSSSGSKESAISVWTASGIEKIKQGDSYESRYDSTTLKIGAFRNEYESAQIILSPQKDVKAYTIALNDLKTTSGDVLSKDSFEVYNQKYILVSQLRDSHVDTGTGMYPDALLPYDVAVAYGENTVKGGENQGIWITVHPTKEQKAGVYTGKFTITADGKTIDVPVTVEIYDYTLSDVTHSKSSFAISTKDMAFGEYDSTIEMQEKYYDFFLEHRVNPQEFSGTDLDYVKLSGESLERFLGFAKKYTLDVRCSHFNIPFYITTATTDSGKSVLSVDWAEFGKTLRAMAEYSVQEGVNVLEKAGTYFIFFDEFDMNNKQTEAEYNLNYAYKFCEDLAEELENDATFQCDDATLKKQILDSLAGIKHKVVGSYNDTFAADKAQFVPTIDKYNTEAGRDIYREYAEKSYGDDAEMWTYTCCSPYNPYPTYHTEDALISARLLSWMMYDYDIVGNLYWASVLNVEKGNILGSNNMALQDYYDVSRRYPSANGDGFLVYPGAIYGIDGPVDTVRFSAIRDGNEDYDLLYALQEKYDELGVSDENFKSVLHSMTNSLYTGTVVRYNDGLTESFATGRELLARLLETASNTGAVIESIVADEDGNVRLNVLAPEGTTVKINGESPVAVSVDGNLRYTYSGKLDKDVNTAQITATKDGKDYSVVVNLGNKRTSFDSSTLVNDTTFIPADSGSATTDTIDGENVLKLDYTQASGRADIDVKTLNITKADSQVIIHVYSYAEEDTTIKLSPKNAGNSSYGNAKTVTLKYGWNEITLTTAELGCSTYGDLNIIRIALDGKTAVSLGIGKITVVK